MRKTIRRARVCGSLSLFMFTIDEQIKCVEREIAMRRNVYPGRISRSAMTPEEAKKQIGCMEAVMVTLLRAKDRQSDFNFRDTTE